MSKEKETERGGGDQKKLLMGLLVNCATELKLLLTALLILCSVATLLQFLPSRFTISTSDLRFCISRISTTATGDAPNATANANATSTANATAIAASINQVAPLISPAVPPPLPDPPRPSIEEEKVLDNGIVKRAFNPHGAAAYNFISMGTYRGGLATFAVIGLSSKPLHVYAKPTYQCEWVPSNSSASPIMSGAYKILPDWGYGRVYTVVVVNCTFSQPINADNSGGTLFLHASTSGGGDTSVNITDRFEVLGESPGSVDFNLFTSKPKYDYLYCGSSLYGNLSPARVREWIAYHVRLFGERSHFVIHDAGGVHPEVMEVLKPWMDLGYVTLQDIREQERFDGYYHNQFMVVNDCLHRYKFMGKWILFFDVDEYIYVRPKNTIKSVMDSLSDYNQFTIAQMPMSSKLCLSADYGRYYRKWGIEKLVYRDTKTGIRRDRKYAIQPRGVFAAGVHMSQNLVGKTTHKTEGKIKYFHYHGTIAQRREPCRNLLNVSRIDFEKTPYVLDTTMRDIAWAVKKFEFKMIGDRLKRTKQ